MNNVSNEIWIILFLGVSTKTKNIQDPLMKSLVGNAEYNSIFEFAKIISDLRSSSFPQLLTSMKNISNLFFVNISIGFASFVPEYCSEFLDFIVKYLKIDIIKDFTIFDDIRKIFESIEYKYWESNIESVSCLLIQNLLRDQTVIDCSAAFINGIHDEDLQLIFWKKLNEKVSNELEKWCSTLSKLISNVTINSRMISSIIPLIVIHSTEPEFYNLLQIIGSKTGIDEIPDEPPQNLSLRLMKSESFLLMNEYFLNVFISLLNSTEHIEDCCFMISELISDVSDKNSYALNALIGQLTSAPEPAKDLVIDTLMRLLK